MSININERVYMNYITTSAKTMIPYTDISEALSFPKNLHESLASPQKLKCKTNVQITLMAFGIPFAFFYLLPYLLF